MQDVNILEEEWSKHGKNVIHRFGQPKLWNVWMESLVVIFFQPVSEPSFCVWGILRPKEAKMLSASLASRAQGVTQALVPDSGHGINNAEREELPRTQHGEAGAWGKASVASRISRVTVHYGVSAAHTTFPEPRKDCSGVCQGSLLQDFWPFFIMLVNSLPDFRDFVNYLVPFNNCVFCWH